MDYVGIISSYFISCFVCILQNKNSDFCAPLTSFDWNEIDPNLLGTSSIDTTCTIWGLEVCITCYGGLTCIYWAHIEYRYDLYDMGA